MAKSTLDGDSNNQRYEKTSGGNVKVTTFDEQNKFSSKNSSKANIFEKKRMSDNMAKIDYKIEEEVLREIFEKKEKTRKGHNVSVTTNTSTTSTNTRKNHN